MHELVPFTSLTIEESFKKYASQDIYTIEDKPGVIVRAGFYDEYDGVRDRFGYYQDHLDVRNILDRLRDNYGLFIPDFHIVIGGNRRFFIVTQRVHAVNLHERVFVEGEAEEAQTKLSRFYSTLTRVLIDVSDNGGKMIGDLTTAGKVPCGNTQWVYGKRGGDSKNQVWLVDLGPCVVSFRPHDDMFFSNQFTWLFAMIIESEKKLGCRFKDARENLLSYMEAEAKTNGAVKELWIDEFFNRQKQLGNI